MIGFHLPAPRLPKEITILSMSGIPRVTSGALSAQLYDSGSNDITFMGIPFSASSAQYVTWAFPLPGDYDGGAVAFIVWWTTSDTTGDVVWQFRATSAGRNEDINGTAMGSTVIVVDTKTTNNYQQITGPTPPCTIAGTPAANHMAFFEVFRDPAHVSDTFSGGPILQAVRMLYTPTELSA